jgi:NADH-quinone oxidoreductase subunit G
MLVEPRKAYLVLAADPELDCADGRSALAALAQAESVIVLSPFKSAAALEYADAILPVSPFSETSGTFVSTEGRVQSFTAVAKPLGDTRPAWKVLRVLGNLAKLEGFDQEDSQSVCAEVFGGAIPEFAAGLDNAVAASLVLPTSIATSERVADVPIHFADALARRSGSLQKTRDAASPKARMNAATLSGFGVAAGERVRVRMDAGSAEMLAQLDAELPDGCVRVAAAHPTTAGLGPLFGTITVEKA